MYHQLSSIYFYLLVMFSRGGVGGVKLAQMLGSGYAGCDMNKMGRAYFGIIYNRQLYVFGSSR